MGATLRGVAFLVLVTVPLVGHKHQKQEHLPLPELTKILKFYKNLPIFSGCLYSVRIASAGGIVIQ
jgi:hypothetical protein